MRKSNQSKQLSYDDKMELDLLENLEFRTHHLCNELRLNEDIHISWSDLCSVLSPSDPSRIADKIFRYFNKIEMLDDKVYHEIYDAIYNIGKNDEKFYNCDVLWISSISHIIYDNFKDQWQLVIEYMKRIHSKYGGSFDLDFLFSEAILTLREECLISDDLFTCVYEYKKCRDNNIEEVSDKMDNVYEDYYGELEYDCGFEDWCDEDERLGDSGRRVLH